MRSCVQDGPQADIVHPPVPSEKPSGSSPFLTAIAIAIGVGTGAVLSTGGTVGVEDLLNGGWLSRPTLAETQRQQAQAIAALEKRIGAVAADAGYLDLRVETVAKRADAALTDAAYLDVRIETVAKRSQDGIATHVAAFKDEVAVLKTQMAGVTALKDHVIALHAAKQRPAVSESLVGRVDGFETGLFDMRNGVSALRSSVHDLAVSHRGEIAALTHRLDKLENVIATEATGSIRPPAANPDKRSNLKTPATPRARTSLAPGLPLQILGHIVDVKENEAPIRSSFAPERD